MRYLFQKYLYILFSFGFCHFANAEPDQMSVFIEADSGAFQRKTYTNGALLYTNRIYTLVNVFSDFDGFDMLSSNGGEINPGIIIPSSDGYVYVLARSGGLKGWEELEKSQSLILNVQLSIYQKQVYAGDRVAIPDVSNFQGATPVAKRIIYGLPTVTVKGELIDIKDSVLLGDNVFAQNTTYSFNDIPLYLKNKQCAFSTSERIGVTRFSCYDTCTVYVAINYKPEMLNEWKSTGHTLKLNKSPFSTITYYLYKYNYRIPNVEVSVLRSVSDDPTSSLFFADRIRRGDLPSLPGTVITRSLAPQFFFITNPSITILPDGDYLAACTGAYRVQGTSAGVSFFLSSDKGLTWKAQSINNGVMSYQNLFVHKGILYLIGTSGVQKDIIIRKSMDKGVTWTYPVNETDGILLQGQYHSAPVPMVVNNGRLWRAFETNFDGENKKAFVMSAPVDANLMNASNWTFSNRLSYQTNWISGGGKSFKQWIEGNVVVNRDGEVVNILRVDEEVYGGVAALVKVNSPSSITFDYKKDIINFPGGGKKFTIRYDYVSDYYWTISNAEFNEDRGKTQNGIYKDGIHCGLLRNRLVLMYSYDLRNWTIKDTIISSDNPFFHGFQYIDWQFENEDIIAVSRTAFEDSEGLPVRQHDANYFTFHRIKNFRNGLNHTNLDVKELEFNCCIVNQKQYIEISCDDMINFDISIIDITGRIMYSQFNTNNKYIDKSGWEQGTYIVKVRYNNVTVTRKIIII